MACKRSDSILAGDVIHVKKGVITLVNRNLKRVSLEKKGKYPYKQLLKLFSLANASFENRFLLQVLDKMLHKPQAVSYAGGVVRGTKDMMEPMDSALILADSIRFIFSNPNGQKLTFFLLDEAHNIIFTQETTDSMLVIKQQGTAWWKPGAYYWEAVTLDKQGTLETKFFIPSNEVRDDLLMNYFRLRNSFPGYPLPVRNKIIEEILRMNRWVMYLPQ
jgi:hypothetical protein